MEIAFLAIGIVVLSEPVGPTGIFGFGEHVEFFYFPMKKDDCIAAAAMAWSHPEDQFHPGLVFCRPESVMLPPERLLEFAK